MDTVRGEVDDVPGVSGWWVDEAEGRVVLGVAAGDDDGWGTCAALAEILDRAGAPYAFEVFPGPVEDAERRAVGFGEAWTDDGVLLVNAWSCNGEPEVTLLEETRDEIRLQITATVPAPGWPGDGCLDTVAVPLEQPVDDRTLTDATSGAAVPVELREPR
ncbi:hypothetical protein [Cellulomonas carbonis]|uniref:Uncharacterized protein n=1 Tax=Cellulomonas carbonis T26 TaxID=947969 RepID=A0A0A0BRY0_9CELL|nr:hypothetical protein [Cellulomonas carbonis]KGM10701.1 hypothetical protein N868_14095 [Cellulomonas carbonis T26]GGC07663.1 hypothetical protein GCM10010972_21170 [Cellulomonas carbonis]